MTFPFNPNQGLIVVDGLLEGPMRSIGVRLALDTAATDTVIDLGYLVAAGYDAAFAPTRVPLVSGTGITHVPLLTITRLTALGRSRAAFPVLGHSLPLATSVDGVLGLDFLRGEILTIDFRSGRLTLS